jgi:hypothetical protein
MEGALKAERPATYERLFRTIGARHRHLALAILVPHSDQPGVAAYFAVLHEIAVRVGLEIQLDLLTAVRARHKK